jgi:hypothetical protein
MIKKIVMWVVFIVIIGLVVAYFGRNWLVERAVESGGEYALGTKTLLGSAEVSLRGGKLDLNNLEVRNPTGFEGGDLLDIKYGHIVVDAGSIFGQEIVIDTLLLDGIKVNFVQNDDKGNFTAVMDHIKSLDMSSSSDDSRKIKIKEVSVQNVSVDGSLTLLGRKEYEKSFAIKGFSIQNVGGENGSSLKQIMALVIEKILSKSATAASGQLSGKLGESLSQAKANVMNQVESEAKNQIEDLGKKLLGGGNK